MNRIKYLKQVSEKIYELSHDEFITLLVKLGINEYPYEDENKIKEDNIYE